MKNLKLFCLICFLFSLFIAFSSSAIAGENISALFLQQNNSGGSFGSTPVSESASYKPVKEKLPRGAITLLQAELPAKSITQSTIDAVRKVHPDFDIIVQSDCLADWAETLANDKRIYYAGIMRNGSQEELVRMMNDYKQDENQLKIESVVLQEHTDFYSVLVSSVFEQWLARQSESIRGSREAGSLSMVSAVLTHYKAETLDFGKPAPKKKRLYEVIRERNKHLFSDSYQNS